MLAMRPKFHCFYHFFVSTKIDYDENRIIENYRKYSILEENLQCCRLVRRLMQKWPWNLQRVSFERDKRMTRHLCPLDGSLAEIKNSYYLWYCDCCCICAPISIQHTFVVQRQGPKGWTEDVHRKISVLRNKQHSAFYPTFATYRLSKNSLAMDLALFLQTSLLTEHNYIYTQEIFPVAHRAIGQLKFQKFRQKYTYAVHQSTIQTNN